MGCVLRIDHDIDLANRYVQSFRAKLVFRNFQQDFPKHSVLEALNANATQKNVESILRTKQIDYISGAGHGRYEMFTGHDGNPIWDVSQNLADLKQKVVHLLSCETGAVLGRAIVFHGATAFWGYTVNFAFSHKSNPPSLEDDDLAEAFLKMDTIIDRGILSGKRSDDIYTSMSKYVAQVAPQLTALDRGLLLDNFNHLACPVVTWGNGAAVIS